MESALLTCCPAAPCLMPPADVPSSTISSSGARSLVVPYASCSRTNCRARRRSSCLHSFSSSSRCSNAATRAVTSGSTISIRSVNSSTRRLSPDSVVFFAVSLRRAPAGSTSSHRTPSLLLDWHRIPPGYLHLYASAANRSSTISDGEGGVAAPALRGRLKDGDLSLCPPGPDASFSIRRFLSDSYSFQEATMVLERREPFTPTVSFPGGRKVSCF